MGDEMPEPPERLDRQACQAWARGLTPEPNSLPRRPLCPRQCCYEVDEATRWRGGTNLALAAALLRLPLNRSVRGIACQWEVHDVLHGMPDHGVDSLCFNDESFGKRHWSLT